MITEDYVSFETTKLLKEKGFNWNTDKQYNLDKIVGDYNITDRSRYPERYLDAPTLQMAMKWLREVHNLFVFPFPQMNTNKFWVEIYQLYNNQKWENLYCESIDLQNYSFYEEACEAAIKYCLKNLI